MIKWYLGIAFLLTAFIAGVLITRHWYVSQRSAIISSENSIVIAEKINKVLKLTAVEGFFSEIYDYKDYYRWDWAPFRKKVLIRVNAKVSIGFDLEGSNITIDQSAQKVYLNHPGSPIILSIDHDLEYYDIQQGAFNSFTESDYSKFQRSAKNFISVAAYQHDTLFRQAEEQMEEVIKTLEDALWLIGWQLEILEFSPSDHQINGPFKELAMRVQTNF